MATTKKRYGSSVTRLYKDGKKEEPLLHIAQVIPVPTPEVPKVEVKANNVPEVEIAG